MVSTGSAPRAAVRWRCACAARMLALLCCTLLAGCTSVFFQPMKAWVRTPESIGLSYEDVTLTAADGTRLSAWYLPAPSSRGAVLFLHGNAQNISTHLASVAWLPAQGYSVLLLDYRGYGRSEGAPSIAGSMLDIDVALRFLLQRPETRSRRVFVFGQSLGGALALNYIAGCNCKPQLQGVIIDSTFTRYRAIAREKLQSLWLTWPLSWSLSLTVTGDDNPIDAIGHVSPVPLLLVHGDADRVIPVHHSQQLYEAARDPKTFWRVPDADHILALTSPQRRRDLVQWMGEQQQ
jgi:fermentation-respiration switch protein FrsA (DUF1100 family)